MVAALLAGAAQAGPLFAPQPAPVHSYDGGWEHFVGGGVAVFDCNGDRLPELFVAGGSNPAQLLVNRSTVGGALRFDASTPAPLAVTGVTGAYPLDIDSDGHLDLVILRAGENLVMRGGADCSFRRWNPPGFNGGDRWTTAFSATWESGRALPTLAFGNYVNRDDPDGPFGTCDDNQLFRPEAGRYRETPLHPGFCALSMLFSDWRRSGRADLRVSNDRHYYVRGGEEQLWAMEPTPRLYSAEEGWRSYALWGMGIASRDLTFDGRPEVFLTSMGDQRLQFFTGGDAPTWEDAPYALGTTAHRPYTGGDGRPSTGWHAAFGDVQNDGLDDIFVAKGNVQQMPDAAMDDPNNLLVQQPDGRFVEMGDVAGLASLHRARGAALADLNRDGFLDVVVVNRRGPLEIFRNVTAEAGRWLTVALHQPAPNVNAVGAFIELDLGDRIVTREITVGGGHAGGTAGPEHFGLGAVDRARLRVIWPDGAASDWATVRAGQHLDVTQAGEALDIRAY